MGMFQQPYAEVYEHLGILVDDFVGGRGVIHGFIEENGYQEAGVDILITVNDGIAEGYIQAL